MGKPSLTEVVLSVLRTNETLELHEVQNLVNFQWSKHVTRMSIFIKLNSLIASGKALKVGEGYRKVEDKQ